MAENFPELITDTNTQNRKHEINMGMAYEELTF
jgi:hypothetical protein